MKIMEITLFFSSHIAWEDPFCFYKEKANSPLKIVCFYNSFYVLYVLEQMLLVRVNPKKMYLSDILIRKSDNTHRPFGGNDFQNLFRCNFNLIVFSTLVCSDPKVSPNSKLWITLVIYAGSRDSFTKLHKSQSTCSSRQSTCWIVSREEYFTA